MRVNPNPTPDLIAAIELTQQQINNDLLQISSGQSVNVPSDNPAASALLVQNADQTSEVDQYLRSIGSVQGEMQNTDATLSSVITALQRAISLGVEGANGTLNATDRAALANEVQGIQSQLVSLANLSYQGKFVFAGTASQAPPYVLDPSTASGVRYVGNSTVNKITVGDHFSVQTNVPGSQIFSSSGSDMFLAIQNLITNLQSGNNVGDSVTQVTNAYNHINMQRVFYGNAVNQLTSQQSYLNSENTQLAQQQSTLGGADMAAVLSDLTKGETSLQATLAATARTGQTNLFDYLK